jgi:site-specific DNA-methyltransferase (adenine-specific)
MPDAIALLVSTGSAFFVPIPADNKRVKPYYSDSRVSIYHGDCREVLPYIGQVDVTITDPPYGEIIHKGALGDGGRSVLVNFPPITADDFLMSCGVLVQKSLRWVMMTCDWRHAAIAEDRGLPVVRLGVWIKPNGAPQFTGDRPGTGWEAVLLLHREGKKYWNGGGHHAVWTTPKLSRVLHPTEKPISLLKTWVKQFSDEGETILDPYMGVGTTLRAAKDLGRKAIGIEINEKYCEIAAKRLEAPRNFKFNPNKSAPLFEE